MFVCLGISPFEDDYRSFSVNIYIYMYVFVCVFRKSLFIEVFFFFFFWGGWGVYFVSDTGGWPGWPLFALLSKLLVQTRWIPKNQAKIWISIRPRLRSRQRRTLVTLPLLLQSAPLDLIPKRRMQMTLPLLLRSAPLDMIPKRRIWMTLPLLLRSAL